MKDLTSFFDKIRTRVTPVSKMSKVSKICVKSSNNYPIIPGNVRQVHPPNSQITRLE